MRIMITFEGFEASVDGWRRCPVSMAKVLALVNVLKTVLASETSCSSSGEGGRGGILPGESLRSWLHGPH